ncbi:MAG: hypothetical protein Q8P73_00985 [bacterium]|nr:hypothetical protein [bacterium]
MSASLACSMVGHWEAKQVVAVATRNRGGDDCNGFGLLPVWMTFPEAFAMVSSLLPLLKQEEALGMIMRVEEVAFRLVNQKVFDRDGLPKMIARAFNWRVMEAAYLVMRRKQGEDFTFRVWVIRSDGRTRIRRVHSSWLLGHGADQHIKTVEKAEEMLQERFAYFALNDCGEPVLENKQGVSCLV